MSKSFNRAQDERALAKARRIAKVWLRLETDASEEDIDRIANTLRHNRKLCSCEMCRNPRRAKHANGTTKLTMQEIKANQDKDYEY